jgi:hypothetical protein
MRAAGCAELAATCLNTAPWLAQLRVLNLSLNPLGGAGSGALGAFLAGAQVTLPHAPPVQVKEARPTSHALTSD